MAIDQRAIQAFVDSTQLRSQISSTVRRAGFTISQYLEYNTSLWGLYLKPNRVLKETLGINQEILFWVSEYAEFQAKSLRQATEIIEQNQPRLSDDFAIIVTGDDTTTEQVEQMSLRSQQYFCGFSVVEMRAIAALPPKRFVLAMQKQFFVKDLYNVTNVITKRRAFFGRDALVRQIQNTLLEGASHCAIFGIRKMGKTSLLFRVIEEIRRNRGVSIAHLDMQRVDAVRPTAGYFLYSLGQQLFDGNAAIRAVDGLKLFGQHDRFPVSIDDETLFEDFDHDIRTVIRESDQKCVLMIDEIELMSPTTKGSGWGNDFVRAWRLLRGIDQTDPGRLRFLITGTNPQCIEANTLSGKENPTYNYFNLQYLQPLRRDEAQKLLADVGSRMGLNWDDDSLTRAFNLVGGHPLLLRLLGSAVHQLTAPRNATVDVKVSDVDSLVDTFISRVGSSLSQMVEVLDDNYPDELMLLKTLASGRIVEFNQYALAFSSEVNHLRGYGLLTGVPSKERIAIEVLQTWLQQRDTKPTSEAVLNGDWQPGTTVDQFEILETLGRPGAFGSVFKARWASSGGEFVALKIFREASLDQLEREVDALEAIRHPNVVGILDHGKLSTGNVYIAMDYLRGVPLRKRCDRANRLRGNQCLSVLRDLLSALMAFHPDEERTKELREKPGDLTIEEFYELNRKSLGYVHRDINPNNVILLDTGVPVLIDFGISSRVNSLVVTDSGTRGYRPPDGNDVTWSVDTDLFALGVTIAQAMTGSMVSELGELRMAVAADDVDERLAKVVIQLCEPQRKDRYRRAGDALADLPSLP